MKRPLALHLVVLAAVLVVAVITVVLLVWDDSEGSSPPDRAALERLAERIDVDVLEREGIIVSLIEIKRRDGRR